MLRRFVLIACLFLSFGLHATQRYQSTVEQAKWRVNTSPIHCELVHEISHYGDGRFVYSSGGELSFQLHVIHAAPKDSVVSLHSVAPFWRHASEREMAHLTLSKGQMPVYVDGDLALKMLYELEAGHHPTFHYKDWATFENDVVVTVSSVNFHKQLDEFRLCISQALPYGADQVKDTAVYFDSDRHHLTESQKKRLMDIMLFARVDKNMHIQLNGHADNRGRRIYNKKLAERRARSVEKYLAGEGVSSAQISRKSYGESRPKDTNRSERGRSINRRVDVIIDRQ